MKKYFKVYLDYSRWLPIEDDELEKALYAFITGKPTVFKMGAATRIESIIPDFNKSLGWNSDYRPTADDQSDLEKVKPAYQGYLGRVKEKVQYLISQGRTDLIGKNIEVPELETSKQLT